MRVKQSISNLYRNMEHVDGSLRFLGDAGQSLKEVRAKTTRTRLARELLSLLALHSGQVRRVRRNALIERCRTRMMVQPAVRRIISLTGKFYRRPVTGHKQ